MILKRVSAACYATLMAGYIDLKSDNLLVWGQVLYLMQTTEVRDFCMAIAASNV